MALGLPCAALAQASAPSNLTAISGATQSLLSWPASTGAASYNVERGTNSGGPYAFLVNVSSTSYTDSGVTTGVEYYYVVAAVSNGVAGPNSPEAAAIPLANNGYYTFINRASGLALGQTNSVAVQQYDAGANQLWKLVSVGNGYFAILNDGFGGLTLTGPTPSAQLTTSSAIVDAAQEWYFQVTNGSYFVIYNLGTGQVMDDLNASRTIGDPIGQWNYDGALDEDWTVGEPMPPLIQAAAVTNDDQLPQAYVSAQVNPNGSPTTVIIQYGTNTAYGLAVTNVLSPSGGYQAVNATLNSYEDRTATLHVLITASNSVGTATSGDLTCSSLLFEKKFSSDFYQYATNYLNPVTGAAAWADLNNDGWLDLVCAGQTSRIKGQGYLYYNPGTNQIQQWLENVTTPEGSHPALSVGDFDNDNRPDIFYACSQFSAGLDGSEIPDFAGTPGPVTGVMFGVDTNYIGSDRTESFLDTSYIPYLYVQDANVAVGDFDHTGRQDALVSGNFYVTNNNDYGGLSGPYTLLCQNNLPAGRYITTNIPYTTFGNEGMLPVNSSLPPVAQTASPDLFSSGQTLLVAGDFDNDGFLDLFALNFPIDSTLTSYAGFFHGDGNKNFTPTTNRFQIYTNTSGPGFSDTESASCVLADLNGDGYLDMVLSYVNQATYGVGPSITSIWLNDGHGNLTNSGIVLPQLDLANVAVGDIFNHGRNDILMVGGLDLSVATGSNVIQTVVLRNDGNGVFTPIVLGNFGSIGETGHGLQLADYDNDGRLDFAMTGDTLPAGNGEYSQFVPGTYIFRNEMNIPSNAPPAAPPGPGTTVGDGTVRFHWGNATDDITPANLLTYNLRVGTNSLDTSVVSPIANVITGWRKLAAPGNCGHVTNILYRFPPGTYYWSVQAVDGGFKGGAWAPEQTFTITNPEPVVLGFNQNAKLPGYQPYPYPAELSAIQYQMALMNVSSNIFNVTSNTWNLSWPARFKNFTLEQATNLAGPWTTNTIPVGTLNDEWSVLVTNSGSSMYFRLVK